MTVDQGRTFVSDPAKWPAEAYPDGHVTHARVCFEWENVLDRNGAPLRVYVLAHNVTYLARTVPGCPIKAQGVRGYRYSIACLDALAER